MVEPDTPEPTTSTSVSSGSYTQQRRDDMETVMLPHTNVHTTSRSTLIFTPAAVSISVAARQFSPSKNFYWTLKGSWRRTPEAPDWKMSATAPKKSNRLGVVASDAAMDRGDRRAWPRMRATPLALEVSTREKSCDGRTCAGGATKAMLQGRAPSAKADTRRMILVPSTATPAYFRTFRGPKSL